MRPCIQMVMMKSQKTHPTATLASSSEETPDNTPKQVRSRIIKKKRLKNKSTVDQEANRNSTKPISNQ